jgi:hypothetical protein
VIELAGQIWYFNNIKAQQRTALPPVEASAAMTIIS